MGDDRGRALLEDSAASTSSALFSCVPVSAHHRTMREDYGDKVKASHWSRSPLRPPRERFELGDGRKPGEPGSTCSGNSMVWFFAWEFLSIKTWFFPTIK